MNPITVFRTNKIGTTEILAAASSNKVLILDCYHSGDYFIDILIDFSVPSDSLSNTFTTFSHYIKQGCEGLNKLNNYNFPNNELLSFIELSDIENHLNQLQTFKNKYFVKAQNVLQHQYGYGVASKYVLVGFIVRKPQSQSILTDSFGKTKMYW